MFGWLLRILSKRANEDRYWARIKDLKCRGLKVGKNVIIHPTAKVDSNYPFLISIGNNCVLSAGSEVIAHDSTLNLLNGNHTKVARVEIKDNCIISKNSIILPGVKIGPNVIVTAGSVVNKDIPPNTCVCGNPARFYCKWEDFFERMGKQIEDRPKFGSLDISKGEDERDPTRKKEILKATKDGPVFIKGHETRATYYVNEVDFKDYGSNDQTKYRDNSEI